jgi:hypothetical protein
MALGVALAVALAVGAVFDDVADAAIGVGALSPLQLARDASRHTSTKGPGRIGTVTIARTRIGRS